MSRYLEKHVGGVLTTLLVSFLVGTIAMIYNSDKNNEVFKTQLIYISKNVDEMKRRIEFMRKDIEKGTVDRWTRLDHQGYAGQVDERFMRLHERMNQLEKRLNNYHQQQHLNN